MSKKLNNKRLEALFDNIPIPKSDPLAKEQAVEPCSPLDIPSNALCDYNGETTPPNNLVLRAEEKNHVSGTEW